MESAKTTPGFLLARKPGTCFYADHHRYQPEVASLYHLRYLHGSYGFFTC
ncbi:Uncharacterised protein [Segatella copri]|nr:Uncharacterised protein [Segatella copri]